MTHTLRRFLPLALAAATVAAPACKRTHLAAEVVPAAKPTSASIVASPAASTAKPIDASDAVRGAQRPQPEPPAPPCLPSPEGREPAVPDLLEQASRDFEKGRFEDALECAREASRVDPQSVAAHHFRGAALTELGHIDEARTAYARALALDPDDPEVLRSAADLHVRRLGGRDDLELALAYTRRAFPRAHRMKDRALIKDLHLLEAMALDDLGRPGEALAAASKAVELDGKDREARREKGVALFELCRFGEAKSELEKLTSEEPDAWAEHYLGLIAERGQDDVAAAAHFARAQKLDGEAFRPTAAPSVSAFARVVQEEVSRLPPPIQVGLKRSNFAVVDLPDVGDLTATDPPLSPGILGLFRPPGDGSTDREKPAIFLYRKNLARAAHNDEELRREVRDTLIHEVGHLNGEDDDQLRDRGL
ncbi:MAG TPA: tetratricopeptide repeat protein [Myxococcales bacterium]|nr:tetratricopeptide repeat protein [Myxococcales bacterium]